MHDTALEFGRRFFQAYATDTDELTIVDIGAQDVNGSLRSTAFPKNKYIGVDFVEGKGVDVIIDDPYSLPFESDSVDLCVSSSCFEHSEFFWLLYLEVMRILKPSGILYLNAPSNGCFHRYPVDCWRFYPDSGIALANWGKRNGYDNVLLESFVGQQKKDIWNDFIAVFLKDSKFLAKYPHRIRDGNLQFTNGLVYGRDDIENFSFWQQDQKYRFMKRGRMMMSDLARRLSVS